MRDMDFAHFRELKGWTLDEAASHVRQGHDEFAGVNGSVVSKHERGLRFPNPDLVKRYSEITDGAVTFDDWHTVYKAAREAREAQAAA